MRLIRRPLLIIFLEICVAAGLPPSSAAPHKTSYSNALRHETSPYLRQHAHNPVNWYPWGPEALQKARRENKPILLSIGYNACHWCHVMERESFMDLGTAKLMNDNFVNIKVDREERPDLDAVYIRAVEEMTGQAGWPLTVFLTPDLQPFYGGTYFPKGDGYDRPSFKRVLKGINHAWRQDGPQIRVAAEKIKQRLLTGQTPIKEALTLNRNLLEQATVTLLQAADAEYGGLLNPDSKRKYPQPCTLELALQGSLPNSGRQASTRNACRSYLTNTLNQMSYGSIHDQLGGGFARYTMDRRWLVPHFEKMLYDNALLAKVYLQAAQAYKNPYWQKIGTSTLDFALRELKTPQGAFGSSLDADSQGQEGKYYLFTAQEIISILGETEGAWFNEIYGITAAGDTRSGQNILHLTASPEQLAKRYALPEAEFQHRLERLKSAVLAARSKRVRPAFDHKILCNWNALITSSLVEGFKVSGNRRYLQAACQTQNFLLSNLYSPGRLHHSWAAGKAGADGFLDDYAFEIQALLDLAAVDGNPRWLQTAQLLSENMLKIFYDQKQQTFVFTPSTVLLPLTDQLDSPTPSGSSQAVLALLRLQRITGKSSYQQIARQVFERNLPAAIKYPSSYACFLSAFDFYLSPSIELVLSINSRKSDWRQLQELINGVYLPHATVVLYDPQTAGPLRSTPLLAERNLINSMPAVYICRNYTCDKPITSPVILKDKLLALSRLSP